jgi:hypothetical protein
MKLGRILNRYVLPAATLAVVAALTWKFAGAEPTHPHMVFLTGWCLFALILFLTAYNARKKLPFLPLLASRTWLRAHSWAGMLAGLVFLLHLRWRMPAGPFEAALAALFVAVTLSGIAGWWLSRVLPPRLTSAGGEVPFERIPVIRRALRERAEALVVSGIPSTGATTLADFYAARLSGFFAGPANLLPHLIGSSGALNSLLSDLGEVKKYLNAGERSAAVELAALVREKDALDLHRSVQLVLKAWLFVHIPLTYGMLVFIAVHVVLVYSYSGGAR